MKLVNRRIWRSCVALFHLASQVKDSRQGKGKKKYLSRSDSSSSGGLQKQIRKLYEKWQKLGPKSELPAQHADAEGTFR